MEKESKNLAYWKANASEDYMKTPISVLRYITELESALSMSGVMQGSVLRICEHCNTEYPIKFSEARFEFVSALQRCPHCENTDHVWVRCLKNPS